MKIVEENKMEYELSGLHVLGECEGKMGDVTRIPKEGVASFPRSP